MKWFIIILFSIFFISCGDNPTQPENEKDKAPQEAEGELENPDLSTLIDEIENEEQMSAGSENLVCTFENNTITYTVYNYEEPSSCRHPRAAGSTDCLCELEVIKNDSPATIVLYARNTSGFCSEKMEEAKQGNIVTLQSGRTFSIPSNYTCE